MTPEEATRPNLDAQGIKCVQAVVGEVLLYGRAVDNKFLVAFISISTQQASATESSNEAIDKLLDYLATYPDKSIVYISISMILAAQFDAVFHNESKVHSQSE